MYKRGISKLKSTTGIADGLEGKVSELRLALNLNLSLSQMKSENWFAAIRAASRALEVDKANVKVTREAGDCGYDCYYMIMIIMVMFV